jgi:GT2 family glycosyltransferase
VSVCVVNWNSRALLEDLLDSLVIEGRRDAGPSIEVIVVDNHSTDDSCAMVARRFPGVCLIRNDVNAGFSRANNQAAAIAAGRHLLFLNNDTRVPPGSIRALTDYLDAHADVVAVGPRLIYPDGRFQPSCRRLPDRALLLYRLKMFAWIGRLGRGLHHHLMLDFDPLREQPVEMIIGAAILIRRDAFFACGRWDEAFTFCVEDADLCARLARHGKIMYLPAATIVHHGSVSAASNLAYTTRHLELGYGHYVARHGRHWWSSPLHKMLVTLDQPVRLFFMTTRLARYMLKGRRDKAAQQRAMLAATVRFTLCDLPRYWWA